MAGRIGDRCLWLGVGVLAFAAAKAIQYAMTDLVRLTELDADECVPRPHDDAPPPEDAISTDTLRTLIHSPNPSIVSAAQHLIIKRFAALPNAPQMLSDDYYSEDEDTRRKARHATRFLREWDVELSALRPDMDQFSSHHLDLGRHGDFLPVMDRSEWHMLAADSGDVALHGHGLLDPDMAARLDALDAADLGGQARFAAWDHVPHARPSHADGEESERRRRRREAMVLHEGDGGIVEDDIIRPRAR